MRETVRLEASTRADKGDYLFNLKKKKIEKKSHKIRLTKDISTRTKI